MLIACLKPHMKCAVPTVLRGGITRFTWTGREEAFEENSLIQDTWNPISSFFLNSYAVF